MFQTKNGLYTQCTTPIEAPCGPPNDNDSLAADLYPGGISRQRFLANRWASCSVTAKMDSIDDKTVKLMHQDRLLFQSNRSAHRRPGEWSKAKQKDGETKQDAYDNLMQLPTLSIANS